MSSLSSPARCSSPTPINDAWWGPPISSHRGWVTVSVRSVASSSSRERNRSGNVGNSNKKSSNRKKKKCTCFPTTNFGSFRCSLHKNVSDRYRKNRNSEPFYWHRLYLRRLAFKNSLVRIGTVERYLLKRALASLRRPSSYHLRRRRDFQPRPSRLSVTFKAED